MNRCFPEALLVGGEVWLPEAPFDYESGLVATAIGCNHIRCGACGELVVNARDVSGLTRRYWCRCQKRDVAGQHLIGSDEGLVNQFVTAWHCEGHPPFALPATLDGVTIPVGGPDPGTITKALQYPPFTPPGVVKPGFWVARLHQLVADEDAKARIGSAVAACLAAKDERTVSAAIGFFWLVPWASGGERLVGAARARVSWFETAEDPFDPGSSLESWLFEALKLRLVQKDASGRLADLDCLKLLEETLLAGRNPAEIVMSVCRADPAWIAQHGDDLVRRGVTDAGTIAIGLKNTAVDQIIAALRPIVALGAAERSEVIRAVERYLSPEKSRQVAGAL